MNLENITSSKPALYGSEIMPSAIKEITAALWIIAATQTESALSVLFLILAGLNFWSALLLLVKNANATAKQSEQGDV